MSARNVRGVRIEISLASLPPSVVLVDAEDFGSFRVLVHDAKHAWIDPTQLMALAGELGSSEAWRKQLDGMLDYARRNGWVSDEGALRAHVDHAP